MKISKPIPYIPKAEEKAQERAEFIRAKFVPLSDIKPVLDSLYVVKTWLDSGASSVIYGESNVGKTFLALDLGLHVAAGTAWHGHRVRQGHVIYIAGEGGGGIRNRLAAARHAMPELAACADGWFTLLPTPLDLHGEGDAAALISAIGAITQTPALVVVDTLARAMKTPPKIWASLCNR